MGTDLRNRSDRHQIARDAIYCGALALAVFAAFGRSAGHGFVNFDTPRYVTSVPIVQAGLTAEGVRWAFRSLEAEFWHPLTWLSIMLDCEWFGLDAGKHHLMSVGYHAAGAVLLFLLLRTMTGAPWRSLLVAGLFALHPLRVESVVWAAQRKDVLSGVFFMGTLLGYGWYARRGGGGRYAVTLALFVLGLMAKPVLVMLPLLLLLLDHWPLGRLTRGKLAPVLKEKIPFFLCAAVIGAITIQAQAVSVLRTMTIEQRFIRLANDAWSIVDSIRDFLWPSNLIPFYAMEEVFRPGRGLAGGVFLIGMSWWAIRAARSRPYLITGWFWYLLMLAPMLGVIRGMSFAKADRYSYLSHIGLSIVVAWGLWEGIEALRRARREPQSPRVVFAGITAAVLAAVAIASWRQAGYWKDSITLFGHVVEISPSNLVGRVTLASAYIGEGRLDEAASEASAALALNAGFAIAHGVLGEVLLLKGDREEGIAACERALQLDPDIYRVHFNLINAYAEEGDTGKVVAHCKEAIALAPRNTGPLNQLAWIHATSADARYRDGARAVELAERLVAIPPGPEATHLSTLAAAYAEAGRFGEAVTAAERALGAATEAGDEGLARGIREQLEEYRGGRPWWSAGSQR